MSTMTTKRPMEWDFDRNLAPGKAMCVDITGLRMEFIDIPEQRPPEWAIKTFLSIEDYGRMLKTASQG
jgi:hypothetical protein